MNKMTIFTLLKLLFLLQFASSSYPLDSSPSPSPSPAPAPINSQSPVAASPVTPSPTPVYSPPAPPSSYLSESPAPAPWSKSWSSAPNEASQNYVSEEVHKKSSGGHKLGVAFGVVGAACVVVFGGLVYKKRRENVRRSRYYSPGNIQLL